MDIINIHLSRTLQKTSDHISQKILSANWNWRQVIELDLFARVTEDLCTSYSIYQIYQIIYIFLQSKLILLIVNHTDNVCINCKLFIMLPNLHYRKQRTDYWALWNIAWFPIMVAPLQIGANLRSNLPSLLDPMGFCYLYSPLCGIL